MTTGVDRRDFLKIAGIGVASGAAAGCSPPRTEEKIIPHVKPSAEQIPGQEIWYNSTCTECGAGCGIRVRNREGRALRIAGNPKHPVNQGGLCTQGHSSLQATYHPDRYRGPLKGGKSLNWEDALQQASNAVSGGKVAILTGALPNGTLNEVFNEFAEVTGAFRAVWEPIRYQPLAAAAKLVLGREVLPAYHFDRAGYILSVGADFLESWLNPVANQARFSQSHGYAEAKMSKLVHLEPRMGVTGANADEWLAIRPGSELALLLGLLQAVLDADASALDSARRARIAEWVGKNAITAAATASGLSTQTIQNMAGELMAQGPGLVVAGGAAVQGKDATQVHVAALLLNLAIGAIGVTVSVEHLATEPADQNAASLADLLARIDAGEVDTLLLYKSNPVYDAPGSLDVVRQLKKVKNIIALDALPNETTALATLVLPDHAALESWGDHRGQAGVWSIQQPAMNPVFETRSAGDVLTALMATLPNAPQYSSFLEALQARWEVLLTQHGLTWREAVARGGILSQPSEAEDRTAATDLAALATIAVPKHQLIKQGDLALLAYPHIHRYDGRFSNRAWCQEIPDPLMQATWSHWAEIHPDTAARLGVSHKDKIELKTGAGAIETFAYITSAVAPDVIATPLGQGHGDEIGRFGSGIDGNVYKLLEYRTDTVTGAPVLAGGVVSIRKIANADNQRITANNFDLVTTDGRKTDLGRGIGQVIGLDTIAKIDTGEMEPIKKVHHGTHLKNKDGFYPSQEYPEYRWGMTIDLGKCTGCAACVAACYAENNIPVVGKEIIGRGREMSWLRIERYFDSAHDASDGVQFVPMLCQHCGNAPCEPVCPVIATYHTVEGLNGMVYNRCVGTRYCGNNCSYKVRRFNYFGYDDPKQERYAWPEPMNLMLNPDLSVRSAGVMEKCTFCVHIIRTETEKSRMTGKPLEDGDVQTACQASCPTEAIVFGNLQDEDSRVSKLSKNTNRGYKILEIINTQPAITYQKRVRHKKTLA